MNIPENEIVAGSTKIIMRQKENISPKYFISYNINFNDFIKVKEFLGQFYKLYEDELCDLLEYYQIKFWKLKQQIINLNLNYYYYKNISVDKGNINELKDKYLKMKTMFIKLVEKKLKIYRIEERGGKNESYYSNVVISFIREDEQLKKILKRF